MRPTLSELNKKIWYRLAKVIVIIAAIAAFIVPWLIQKPSPWVLIDGFVNATSWLFIGLILSAIILYIIYGKQERTAEDKKRMQGWIVWGTASVVLVLGFLILVISLIF